MVSIREEKLSIKGKQSGLAPTVSGLQIGQSGELYKKRFTVLGRVRYKYDEGHWDEWHLRFNDGSECWLSEDEGEFCLEQPAKPSKDFRSISGFVVITESHLAIHTWPEHNYAAVDLFTCGHNTKMQLAHDYLVREFRPKEHTKTEILRGTDISTSL